MKNISLFFLLTFAAFVTFAFAQRENTPKTIKGKVVSVESGNMLTVRDKKNKYTVKLAGINIPKFAFRKQSAESLSNLAKGKDVGVKVLKTLTDNSNQNILIAEVEISGKDAAFEQISAGMAWSVANDGDIKPNYKNAQSSAQENKYGMWGFKFTPCQNKNQKTSDLPEQNPNSRLSENIAVSGAIDLEIEISEKGDVTSAKPLCGHPMLQTVSAEAALESKFEPTLISGVPYKVKGIITYVFTPK